MPINRLSFCQFLFAAVIVVTATTAQPRFACGQSETDQTIKKTSEPVFRLSKLVTVKNEAEGAEEDKSPKKDGPVEHIASNPEVPAKTVPAPVVAPHPLDQALTFAKNSLQLMQSNVDDYTAILAKRERVNGVKGSMTYMSMKIRCPRTDAQGKKIPFSIYMKFLKPKDVLGREVIWVDGSNNGQMFAHDGRGIGSLRTFKLDPNGMLAKRGQRYPVYSVGIENLIIKLIEKAERDRVAGDCVATYDAIKQINKRKCRVIEVTHDECRAPFEFHKAMVFVDDELNLPVRYAAYDWPVRAGGQPELIEEYTYFNIKTNVGLDDSDFDPANRAYKFPGY